MKKAPESIIEQWTAWRRARDNEATAYRKSLGLCISVHCEYLAVENSTRCEKHSEINRVASQRFATKRPKCKTCDRQPRQLDENGICYYCRTGAAARGTVISDNGKEKRVQHPFIGTGERCERCNQHATSHKPRPKKTP